MDGSLRHSAEFTARPVDGTSIRCSKSRTSVRSSARSCGPGRTDAVSGVVPTLLPSSTTRAAGGSLSTCNVAPPDTGAGQESPAQGTPTRSIPATARSQDGRSVPVSIGNRETRHERDSPGYRAGADSPRPGGSQYPGDPFPNRTLGVPTAFPCGRKSPRNEANPGPDAI